MKKLSILIVFLSLLATQSFAGGPWPKPKGSGFAQLGFYGVPPTNALFANGTNMRFMNRAVFDGTAQLYAEYGLTNKITIHTSLPLKFLSTSANTVAPDTTGGIAAQYLPPSDTLAAGSIVGLGNYELGGKYGISFGKLALGYGVNISMPTGRFDKRTGLNTAYKAWGFSPSVSLGTSGKKWYVYADGGVTLRTDSYAHDWFASGEFGYNIFAKAYLSLNIHSRFAFGPGREGLPFNDFHNGRIHTGTAVNRQGYLSWAIKGYFPFTKADNVGATIYFAGAFAGNAVQASPAMGVGFFYKWNQG